MSPGVQRFHDDHFNLRQKTPSKFAVKPRHAHAAATALRTARTAGRARQLVLLERSTFVAVEAGWLVGIVAGERNSGNLATSRKTWRSSMAGDANTDDLTDAHDFTIWRRR